MEFKVDVPNATGGVKVFKVRARCWDRQLFVVPSDPTYEPKKNDISLVEDPLAIPKSLQRKADSAASRESWFAKVFLLSRC